MTKSLGFASARHWDAIRALLTDYRAALGIIAKHEGPVASKISKEAEEAIAALSALPAGGEKWEADGIKEALQLGRLKGHEVFYTTPQPPAAEELGPHPLNICPKCKDYYMDCECPADAAEGAQGEWPMFTWSGLALRKLGELRKQGWAVNGYALYRNGERGLIDLHGAVHWIAAPAAGKGVDDAMVERAEEAYADAIERENEAERLPLMGRMHVAMRAALEAALTRQPVAGDGDADFELWQDGEFVAGSSSPGTVRGSATQWLTRAEAWREILHYAEQYEQDGAVTILEVTRRPLAAPADTPTDGGEGK